MKLMIASNNEHKIREIKAIVGGYFDEVLSQREAGVTLDVEENGSTFAENALLKARKIYDFITTQAVYRFMPPYLTVTNIPEYFLSGLRGDCGVQAITFVTLCRLCVDYLPEILGELKNFIISYPFASTEEEIHFFKELKPLLASKIIYYNTVYKIEVRFPSGSEEVQRDYLLSETDRISKSFQRNLAFYQYHRTKATYLDRQYFMRGKPDIQIIVDSFYYETDPQFSTSHDFKVAKILANELLEIYLTNRLHELERREQRKRVKNGFMGKVLRWTGTKRALVELIYALDACGCLNKGTVDIKEIVAYFEYVFDIDLGDFYHTYMELKAKTKDRTGFLSTLKDRLLMRMREQD
mgnify:CR=1 FL=1